MFFAALVSFMRSRNNNPEQRQSLATRWPNHGFIRSLATVSALAGFVLAVFGLYARSTALADDSSIPALITSAIVERSLTSMPGNTRPAANAANDRGLVADAFPMQHL